jgi:hypothetical protein
MTSIVPLIVELTYDSLGYYWRYEDDRWNGPYEARGREDFERQIGQLMTMFQVVWRWRLEHCYSSRG